MKSLNTNNIIAIDVYLEKRKTRIYVGTLSCKIENKKKIFHFEYDMKYLHEKEILPLGPELPLTKQIYEADVLFPSFLDRIPSRENPAYKDYCEYMGISVAEKDPIVLLATIGKRGPSSFVFEPVFNNEFDVEDLKRWRKELGLTLREFALIFDISYSNLQKIESNKTSGKDILKRLQVYYLFPEAALYEVLKTGFLHSEKKKLVISLLERKIKDTK